MHVEAMDLNKEKVGFLRFRPFGAEYLVTNDIGEYCFLRPQEFSSFLSGKIEGKFADKYSELREKQFIRDQLDFDLLTQRFARKNTHLCHGPNLHIVVVTLRCDHKCIYCQTSSRPLGAKGLDMDLATAKMVVDMIFASPNHQITIEFQGGEPLVNWEAVKFIIQYALAKNKSAKKKMIFSLVTNLTFMTKEKLKFLMKNDVSLCTSLDGPEALHNKNRACLSGKNRYRNTVRWIKAINREIKKSRNYGYKVNALTTVTRYSLAYPKKIVDEFVNLGLEGVHLRPVNPFGIDRKMWGEINFSPEAFLKFYIKAMDYIIRLNLRGINFYERTARIFLAKILTGDDPNFLDLRSPCGAGIGQLAYNFNGDVYTCDEGRMLSMRSDQSFLLGNLKTSQYEELINNDVTKTVCYASCLTNLPGCSDCVYLPYCGTCPIFNYLEGNIFNRANDRCKIAKGILDYLFVRLRSQKDKEVFLKWVEKA